MKKDNKKINLNEMGAVINVDELSQVMKISKTIAYELVKSKGFPVLKLGKRILIPIGDLLNWLSSNVGNSL